MKFNIFFLLYIKMKKLVILLLLPITIFSQTTKSEINLVVNTHFNLFNEYRITQNTPKLQLNNKLCELAQQWAEHMYNNNKLVHSKYPYPENIYWQSYPDSIAFRSLDSWILSPGHNKNMLAPLYESIGIGFYNGYGVQIFE